jgi:hypothetical protein
MGLKHTCKAESMKTKLAIAMALVIIAAASLGTPNGMAKGMPFQAGYDHGCRYAKLMFSERYINQPDKGPSFHTQGFMSGYNAGLSACSHESSSVASNVGASGNSSALFKQGYAKGVSDAKSQQSSFPASTTMHPDDVDCNSDIDPQVSNEGYCDGYQHGFADTNNKLLAK